MRAAQAEQAAVVAAIEQRGAYRSIDGHRSMRGYLRATCNHGDAEVLRQRTIARACAAGPAIGTALAAGHIGVAQGIEIARIHRNPRTRCFFDRVAPVYLQRAEHDSLDDLRSSIDDFLTLADQDGAFAELHSDVEGRTASVQVVGGSLHARVSGGDPIVAEEVLKTFEWFCEREFARDVAERAERHGDRAAEHPLRRTDAQRRFDAVVAMARAARSFGDGARPADVVVNLVSDPVTMYEAFAEAELVVATTDGVETVELADADIDPILAAATADPVEWTRRRRTTSRGTAIHPRLLLRAVLHRRRPAGGEVAGSTMYPSRLHGVSGTRRCRSLRRVVPRRRIDRSVERQRRVSDPQQVQVARSLAGSARRVGSPRPSAARRHVRPARGGSATRPLHRRPRPGDPCPTRRSPVGRMTSRTRGRAGFC
ncbi:MAG: hypothetical protein ACO23O_04485 [Ilumatobacteraceae bacterium]